MCLRLLSCVVFLPDQVLVIDDAQKLFEHTEFWQDILKTHKRDLCLICAASYSLESVDRSTPTDFSLKYTYADLQLEPGEAETLVRKFASIRDDQPLFKDPILQASVISEADGNVGVLRTSLEKLSQHFAKQAPSVATALSFQCSTAFFGQMSRCFLPLQELANDVVTEVIKEVIMSGFARYTIDPLATKEGMGKTAIKKAKQKLKKKKKEHEVAVKTLLEGCVLVQPKDEDQLVFATPMHKRFYMSQLYPSCAQGPKPTDMDEFLVQVLMQFSKRELENTLGFNPKSNFPSESTFQVMFYRYAASLLPPANSISAEVSRIVTGGSLSGLIFLSLVACVCVTALIDLGRDLICCVVTGDGQGGFLDFFINGMLRWGVELMISGDRKAEHLARFGEGGKYEALKCAQYRVVDFRTGTGIPKKHYVCVSVAKDFTSAVVKCFQLPDKHVK
jgi:hypothetical protein